LTSGQASNGPGDGAVFQRGSTGGFDVHFRRQRTGHDNIVEFNAAEILHLEFEGEVTGVLVHGHRQRALLRTRGVGVQALSQGHHLLAVDLVGHGVVGGGFEFVHGDMVATQVR